jgi:hypothetical protein
MRLLIHTLLELGGHGFGRAGQPFSTVFIQQVNQTVETVEEHPDHPAKAGCE